MVRGGDAVIEREDIRKTLVAAHQEFEKNYGASIKMQFVGGVAPNGTSIYQNKSENLWSFYFTHVAEALEKFANRTMSIELRKTREQGYALGQAEAEIRGDGVPFTGEA